MKNERIRPATAARLSFVQADLLEVALHMEDAELRDRHRRHDLLGCSLPPTKV